VDKREVAVATMTLVRDSGEEPLLRHGLLSLARHGMPVSVTDGGSGEPFRRFVQELPQVRLTGPPPTAGLVPQVQESLRAASERGRRFILYTEPDKQRFFESGLADFMAGAPDDEQVGVVIASRSPGAFGTFPLFQQFTEGTINRLCGELIGGESDYSYGPFLLNRRLVERINDLTTDVGWGWRHFLFGLVPRLGYRVHHVSGRFECPPEQRDEDAAERLHRIRQLGQNVQGLLLSQSTRV
jgi:hypothetical protein